MTRRRLSLLQMSSLYPKHSQTTHRTYDLPTLLHVYTLKLSNKTNLFTVCIVCQVFVVCLTFLMLHYLALYDILLHLYISSCVYFEATVWTFEVEKFKVHISSQICHVVDFTDLQIFTSPTSFYQTLCSNFLIVTLHASCTHASCTAMLSTESSTPRNAGQRMSSQCQQSAVRSGKITACYGFD